LNVVTFVLLQSCILMAPYTPFIVESMYLNLRKVLAKDSKYLDSSIHFLRFPVPNESLVDEILNKAVGKVFGIID
jgi:isoleucyl-tRNA synthetase